MAEQSYNLKYTGKEIDDLLDKANDMNSSAQVPTGGAPGQVLTKKSDTDFDASWKDAPIALPDGGDSGQVLTKNSSTNGDASWKTPEAPSNPLPTGGTTGQVLAKKSDTNYDTEWIDTGTGSFNPSSNAGAHNAIYRGEFLGNSVTEAQYAAISAGTFDDLYIGDYWTIGGVNYRIGAFDYYLNSGDTACTAHHVTLVPDVPMYSHVMNYSNVTTGGYVGSNMYTTGLADAKTTINNAFGSTHILTHRQYLCNAVSNGKPSGSSWYNSTVELMTEQNVYGGKVFGAGNDGSTVPALYTVDKSQYPLFAFRPDLISNRTIFWLRDVASAAYFSFVGDAGDATYGYASSARGVRPAFSIKS